MDFSGLNKLNNISTIEDKYEILEETLDYIVVYKRNGLAVQITDDEIEDLETHLNKKYTTPVFVLNRIDQPVNGLVIFGKTKAFTEIFTQMIKDREVTKVYLALVSGEPLKGKQTLVHFLKKLHNRAMTADEKIDQNYKESILEYELLQSFDNYHLLKINLKTGRFHQIRAQLATVGLPIKGDIKYGSRRPNIDKSIGLLSYVLEFKHPFDKQVRRYTAPFPTNDILWTLIDKDHFGKI